MKSKIKRFLNYLYISIRRPEMEVLPGNLAFFFIMMMIPLLTILGIVIANINIGNNVYEALVANFPDNIATLIMSMAGDEHSSIGTLTLIVVSLILASNGTYSIIVTSNSVYGNKNKNYIKNKIKSIFLLIALILMITILIIIPVINSKVINFIQDITKFNIKTNTIYIVYKTLKYPVTFLLIFVIVNLLYKFSSNKIKNRRTTYGAIFTSLLLVIVTWAYSFYIEYFNTYETFYGGISSLLILMLYFYIISYVFVLGMNINYAREKIREENNKN